MGDVKKSWQTNNYLFIGLTFNKKMALTQKSRVIQLYKQLIYMGRDYPKEPEMFRIRCHNAFLKNKDVQDPEKIEQLIGHGNYIVKELEALYMLKKYRTLKRRYYDTDDVINKKLEEMQKVIRDV